MCVYGSWIHTHEFTTSSLISTFLTTTVIQGLLLGGDAFLLLSRVKDHLQLGDDTTKHSTHNDMLIEDYFSTRKKPLHANWLGLVGLEKQLACKCCKQRVFWTQPVKLTRLQTSASWRYRASPRTLVWARIQRRPSDTPHVLCVCI